MEGVKKAVKKENGRAFTYRTKMERLLFGHGGCYGFIIKGLWVNVFCIFQSHDPP